MRRIQSSKRKSPSLSARKTGKPKGMYEDPYAGLFIFARQLLDFTILDSGDWWNSIRVNDEHGNVMRTIKGYGEHGKYS